MKFSTLFLFLFIATSLFAQNNSLTNYKSYLDINLKSWTEIFNGFQLTKFKLDSVAKFENIPDDIKKLDEFYEIYKPTLSFSPDSTKFIDIYSYWLNLEKKGNEIIANPDVDQLVSLYDINKNDLRRIFFCGYSIRIDEAIWINDTKFILAGTFLDKENIFHPEVLVGDILKKKLFIYTDSSSVTTDTSYAFTKLKKLNVLK